MPLPLTQSLLLTDGESVVKGVYFFEDFLHGPAASATDDAASFDLVGSSATLALSDATAHGGVGILTSNSTTEAQLVANGEAFVLAANRKMVFETRLNLADADGMNFFAGLAITDADVHATNLTDYIGFFTTDGNIKIGCGKDNDNVPGSGTTGETDLDSGVDFADTTFVTLKFIVDGTSQVRFFVDGVAVGTIDTNLPDNEALTPTLAIKGSGEVINIDYVVAISDR